MSQIWRKLWILPLGAALSPRTLFLVTRWLSRTTSALVLSLFLGATSLEPALSSVATGVGFSYTFTANGVSNTVNWNTQGLSDFSIIDGGISGAGSGSDAFDYGALIDLCATSGCTYSTGTYSTYTGVGTAASSTLYQGATVTNLVAGLNATVSYKFSTTTASARILVQLDNTTGSALTRTVRLRSGLGCDGNCYLKYQSNNGSTLGNYYVSPTAYTTNSYWTITSDNSGISSTGLGSDPIVSYAYGSSGTSVSPSTTITSSAGDNLFTTMDVTIPANSTRYLAFALGFAGITTTANTLGDAYNGVNTWFTSWNSLPSDIRSDLTNTQLSQILNWSIGPNAYANISVSLTASATTAVKGTNVTITAQVNQAGVVTFFWNGKRIPGCIKRTATTSATCQWKPNVSGNWSVTALLDPNNPSYFDTLSPPLSVFVFNRSGNR